MRTLVVILALLQLPLTISLPKATAYNFPFKKLCIVELATATWCGYCPVAERALEEIEQQYDPSQVVIFAHHTRDSFAVAGGVKRLEAYGATATPIAIFNGQEYYVGGDGQAKSMYINRIERQLDQSTPFLVHLVGTIDANVLRLSAYVLAWDNLPPDINYTFLIGQFDAKDGGRHYSWVTLGAFPKPTGTPIALGVKTITKLDLSVRLGSVDPTNVFAAFVLESFKNKNIFQVGAWRPDALVAESFEPSQGATLANSPEAMKITFPSAVKLERAGEWVLSNNEGKTFETESSVADNIVTVKPKETLGNGQYSLSAKPGKAGLGNKKYYLHSPAFIFFKVQKEEEPPSPPPPPPEPPKPAKLSVDKLGFDLGEVDRAKNHEFRFTITNDGEEKLAGKISTNCGFLSVSPASFGATPVEVICKVDNSKLKGGEHYFCKINIESNGGNASLGVHLFMSLGPSKLEVRPSVIDFGKELDAKRELDIKNVGEAELVGTATPDQSWIVLSSEKLKAGEKIIVSIKSEELPKLAPGEHKLTGKIVFESNGGKTEVEVQLTVEVATPPIIIDLMVGSKYAIVSGQTMILQSAPFIVSGKTVVPLRFIVEVFGGKTEWDAKNKSITITFEKKGTKVIIKTGSQKVEQDGKTIEIPLAPFIKNGITFVPLRFFSDVVGANVEWFANEKSIKLIYQP